MGNLRPVDLARAAGISAQQVRNYADAGILPPAERSPTGYRRFTDRHRLALLDAGHAHLHAERGSLRDAGEALAAVAEQESPAGSHGALRIGELARVLGIRPSALRVWEDAGLLAPAREPGTGYRTYGPAEVRDARMIHMLRQSYYPLPQIAPVLDGLRRTGGSEELRAAIARRQDALNARSAAMLHAATQLHAYLEAQADSA